MALRTALRHTTHDSWKSIREVQEPRPTVGNHEGLIKVRRAPLNYRDVAIATGKYPFSTKDQVVPGSDDAGDVVESVVKIPESSSLSYAQWASVVCTGVTAWNAPFGALPLKPGQNVLFQGTGGVSVTGLTLAKAADAIMIITSSSDDKLQYVKEKYGVDHVINYKKTPDWASEVQKITAGRGVDFIIENGGSGTIKQSLDAIAFGGTIALIGFLSIAAHEDMPDVALLTLGKGANVRGIMIGSKEMLEDAVCFIGSHDLAIPVEKTFNFGRDSVINAFDYMISGQHIGKICIDF
ncbi:hypothetical protein ASPNIDRAFT_142020 [Aspergillus niger ATCC 1015]|uniref:Enoyl reductase (ER) domain-containing protein n=1 Tax=Aspergillus niger (strain ATCC 1015 / CBS 113.46 / FGSC A1144 / LSHB Ac4 / NCTC 3858a / NRRL 328 / USDA 3528.7) TaxID=380704 RepID=G3XQI6_ASPNA|nr:hypothetical protein ASPNIDRAFT_142020 [Aspergillus niger ATCC 1015]